MRKRVLISLMILSAALSLSLAPNAAAYSTGDMLFGSQTPLSSLSSEYIGISGLDLVASSILSGPTLWVASSCLLIEPCY
ncbi:hypothetical protein COCCU_05085 [Corynebacterium occultum]|uniref:Secreted protein n=1 Tax=Corynebacterium occultum TaxID=2675219 RepID=A0A6B8VS49_9CORY|nr:hypothetical protein [Corynebacterium occultum]QGU06963.1 hypothetical protein COCCU_05085 [Corynebacterium occultum]